MSTVIIILAVLAGIIGIAGSVIPGLPGPPVSWLGLMVLYFWGHGADKAGDPMTLTFLLVWLAVTVAVSIVVYVVPAYLTRVTGGSKAAGRGALIGLFAGMFIPPVGIILGSLAGAFLAELLIAGKGGAQSVKSALGAFAGFICGTGIKLIASGLMMYYIIVFLK